MNEQEMREAMPSIIADYTGVSIDRCVSEARFIEDLGCDSLDIVEITMGLEERFDCMISDDEMEKVQTVGDASNLLAAKINGK